MDFKFTTSDASDHGARTSRLADALQTIVASEHNYAQYIKSFRYGVSEGNNHNALLMARLLWDSVADPCKILNTTLLLMAKQSVILESFQYVPFQKSPTFRRVSTVDKNTRWDIPIELSAAVYQALHKIQSLRHLRIRLDIETSVKTVVHHTSVPPNHPSNTVPPPIQITQPFTFPAGTTSHSNHPPAKLLNPKTKTPTRCDQLGSRTLSRFKYLTSLTLLGISDLSCLTEISGCLKSSSASLKSLTLSISQDLALKSRRPSVPNPTVDELSETDPDEDEDTLDVSQPPMTTTKQQINEADIRKEKIAQEAILARIFDLQGVSVEGKKLERNLSLSAKSGVFEDPDLFTQDAKIMMRELTGCYNNLGGSEDSDRRRAFLELTVKAAQRYLSAHPKKTKKPIEDPGKPANQASKPPPMSSGSVPPGFDFGDFGIPGSGSASSASQCFLGGNLPSTSSVTSGGGEALAAKLFGPDGALYSDSYTSPYLLGSTGSYPMPHSIPPMPPPVHNTPYSLSKLSSSTKASYNPGKCSSLSKGSQLSSYKKSALSSTISHPPSFPNTSTSTADWNKIYPMLDGTNPEGQENIYPFQAVYDENSEEESENAQATPHSGKPILFSASDPMGEAQHDSMDIDMEHSDEDTTDTGADQEMVAETEEAETLVSPRKRAKLEVMEPSCSVPVGVQTETPNTSSTAQDEDPSNRMAKSPDDAMQDYIRATHGLQLEEFSLYLIPLKSSVVARGLDLNVLKRLALLNVGSQDPFWLLLVRLQNRSIQLSLESIHTDDVSFAFLDFLKTFHGLKELFMYERSTKHETDQTVNARTGVDITSIRKKGLRKHIKTLKRLMIRNENDEAWDLDPKTIALLCGRGGGLRELAISMSMDNFVSLLILGG